MKIHPEPVPPIYRNPDPCTEDLRLEVVTVCVGFDDILDETLRHNHCHFDTLIVITSHADKKTQAVARKHGAMCVHTDLFSKNGRKFNKGAAINAGFNYFQYHGWRMHMDSDIIVPDNFRRLLFNHHHLEKDWLYGADRMDVVGKKELAQLKEQPQHQHRVFISTQNQPLAHRYLDPLHGYVPLGFFQLWHASCQKPYPYSLGTAAHDDVAFSTLWPRHRRQLLPGVICHHLCAEKPYVGQNWDGRRAKRLSS